MGLTLDDSGVLAFGGAIGFGDGVFGEDAGLCITGVPGFGLTILFFLVGGTNVDDALDWLCDCVIIR